MILAAWPEWAEGVVVSKIIGELEQNTLLAMQFQVFLTCCIGNETSPDPLLHFKHSHDFTSSKDHKYVLNWLCTLLRPCNALNLYLLCSWVREMISCFLLKENFPFVYGINAGWLKVYSTFCAGGQCHYF